MTASPRCGCCGIEVPVSGPGVWHAVPCQVGTSCGACHDRVRDALEAIAEAAKLLPLEIVESAAEQMRARATFTSPRTKC